MKNVLKKPIAAFFLGFLSLGAACSWSRFDDATDQPAIAVLHASESVGDVMDIRGATGRPATLFSVTSRSSRFYGATIPDPENLPDRGSPSRYECTVKGDPELDCPALKAQVATLNAGSVAYIGRSEIDGVPGECWVHGFRARPYYDLDSSGFAVTCVEAGGNSKERIVVNLHSDLDRSPLRKAPKTVPFEQRHESDPTWLTVLGPNVEGLKDKFLFPNLAAFSSWEGGHFVAGTPDIDRAFVYVHLAPGTAFASPDAAWGTEEPIALDPGNDGAQTRSFGAAVATVPASAAAPTSLGVVVAEPVSGKLFLYDVDTSTRTGKRRGCITGAALSGIVLHGYADNGKRVFAASNAAGTVVVYDFDAVTNEACAAATPLATLTCGETPDVTGCADGAFGFSLTHGDIDGDGDQELLVGAPGMNAREKVNAGALYVYDLEAFSPAASDVLFVGNPKNGLLLGTSVTTMRSGSRDLPVGGAPGNRDVMVFYCGALSKASPRCQ